MKHFPPTKRPKNVSKEDKRFMTKISFVVVLAIYIVLTSLTIASVFFDFGNLSETQENLLAGAFFVELSVTFRALFRHIFNIE